MSYCLDIAQKEGPLPTTGSATNVPGQEVKNIGVAGTTSPQFPLPHSSLSHSFQSLDTENTFFPSLWLGVSLCPSSG